MLRTVFYRWLLKDRMDAVEPVAHLYETFRAREEIETYQIAAFNEIWKTAYSAVPYYRKQKIKYNLPDCIESLSELKKWPILTKADLRDTSAFAREDGIVATGLSVTGGSTGEPTRIPTIYDPSASVSQTLGRQKYGVEIGDRTFLLWGHEHLYGTGLRRKVNALKRRLKDRIAGWTRFSAYDLSEFAMQNAYAAFLKSDAKFIIGFSPAVLAFVRQNHIHAHLKSRVEVILCTAGPLSNSEKDEIVEFFTWEDLGQVHKPRLCMEYGSVECAIMAYTRPEDGEYDVFWHTHLIQAEKQEDGEYKNIVTRLTANYVPLIRYDIGDYLDMGSHTPERLANLESEWARSVLHFKSVKGRPSEMLEFACGVSFFGALIGDCVKQVPEVVSSQIAVDEGRNLLEIRITANTNLDSDALSLIKNRFELTVANANQLVIRVVQVDNLFTTVGGKTPRVVRL